MADRSSTTVPARPDHWEPLADSTTIQVLAMAIHDVCGRLTAGQLEEMRRSVGQACLIPKDNIGWDRRAAAHAEIFGLAAGLMAANSSKRLLAFLSAGDAEGAAHEAERHLTALRVMSCLANCS